MFTVICSLNKVQVVPSSLLIFSLNTVQVTTKATQSTIKAIYIYRYNTHTHTSHTHSHAHTHTHMHIYIYKRKIIFISLSSFCHRLILTNTEIVKYISATKTKTKKSINNKILFQFF